MTVRILKRSRRRRGGIRTTVLETSVVRTMPHNKTLNPKLFGVKGLSVLRPSRIGLAKQLLALLPSFRRQSCGSRERVGEWVECRGLNN